MYEIPMDELVAFAAGSRTIAHHIYQLEQVITAISQYHEKVASKIAKETVQ